MSPGTRPNCARERGARARREKGRKSGECSGAESTPAVPSSKASTARRGHLRQPHARLLEGRVFRKPMQARAGAVGRAGVARGTHRVEDGDEVLAINHRDLVEGEHALLARLLDLRRVEVDGGELGEEAAPVGDAEEAEDGLADGAEADHADLLLGGGHSLSLAFFVSRLDMCSRRCAGSGAWGLGRGVKGTVCEVEGVWGVGVCLGRAGGRMRRDERDSTGAPTRPTRPLAPPPTPRPARACLSASP
jgi:hypothetical protein